MLFVFAFVEPSDIQLSHVFPKMLLGRVFCNMYSLQLKDFVSGGYKTGVKGGMLCGGKLIQYKGRASSGSLVSSH